MYTGEQSADDEEELPVSADHEVCNDHHTPGYVERKAAQMWAMTCSLRDGGNHHLAPSKLPQDKIKLGGEASRKVPRSDVRPTVSKPSPRTYTECSRHVGARHPCAPSRCTCGLWCTLEGHVDKGPRVLLMGQSTGNAKLLLLGGDVGQHMCTIVFVGPLGTADAEIVKQMHRSPLLFQSRAPRQKDQKDKPGELDSTSNNTRRTSQRLERTCSRQRRRERSPPAAPSKRPRHRG